MKRITRFVGVGVLALGLSTVTNAQACFGPDGLDGPCCATSVETLPTFPILSMAGSALGWDSCNPLPKTNVTIVLGAPSSLGCGAYEADILVEDSFGNIVSSGIVEMQYSRTWDEVTPTGTIYQVFRFLIMGDVNTLPPSALGGLLPDDSPSFYHGYVDYARGCNFVTWDYAFVLFHNCDSFQHMPFFSADPGPHDPTRTFAFVAPDTAAQPFDHTAIVPPLSGVLARGSMRDPVGPGSVTCPVRDQVQPAGLTVTATGCVCPFSGTLPPRNATSELYALGACGGQLLSLDVTPSFPWRHLISTSIGRWGGITSYPGQEAALVYEGPLLWHESCPGGAFGSDFAELHYGSGTLGGWPQLVFPSPSAKMLDLCSNWSKMLPGPTPLPLVGAVMPTPAPFKRHIFNLDLL